MAYVSVNGSGIITAISDRQFAGAGGRTVKIVDCDNNVKLLGKRLAKKQDQLKLAVICNWGQECGISTYSRYLVDSLRSAVTIKIFSEEGGKTSSSDVIPCWSRGASMTRCMKEVLRFDPDFVLIQHEFGIFPRAPYLLQMLQSLDNIPYAVVLHSVYEHLDKSVCTAAMRNIIVHTEMARDILRGLGNGSKIDVIPHGCVVFPERHELWNIYQTKHVIVQFGFGFSYKGVDRAIDAIHLLKTSQPLKYDNVENKIFYCYYCSENNHTQNIHSEYVKSLTKKIELLGLEDNVVIIRKWNTDHEINNILRTAKLAIYPYLINPDNVVYGASGALRISFANGIPCLASESHLFDEIPGLPRPSSVESLASEIDRVFSDWKYRDMLVGKQDSFVSAHTWEITANRYLEVMKAIRSDTTMFY